MGLSDWPGLARARASSQAVTCRMIQALRTQQASSGSRFLLANSTPKGFEPLRAEPNGFLATRTQCLADTQEIPLSGAGTKRATKRKAAPVPFKAALAAKVTFLGDFQKTFFRLGKALEPAAPK